MSLPAPDMDVSVNSEPSSMLHVRASSMYPLPITDSDSTDADTDSSSADPLPFPLLCGEARLHAGLCVDGGLALTNYRLFLHQSTRQVHVPLALIDQVEVRDLFYLHIWCKDARSYRCTFDNNDMCTEWFRRLSTATAPVHQLPDLFAFCFFAWASERENEDIVLRLGDGDDVVMCGGSGLDASDPDGTFRAEVERLGFDLHGAWRISQANVSFRLCSSYPPLLLVPACISDDTLETVARFRSARRVPAVVWRHSGNGAVIARCSQPEVGWLGWRSAEDEDLLKAIADACAFDRGPRSLADSTPDTPVSEPGDDEERIEPSSSKKVLIMDARSYTTAVANRARGGGCECPEYYPSCDIQFMNLANIHSIRKSFQSLRALCAAAAVAEQPNWLSLLEGTRWLQHMSGLLRAAAALAAAVERDARPALVHCSDGWDRTPQIVALAQLLLDPHYRTLTGFRVLVEREWLGFGHKFADRCGHAPAQDDPNERCPVFLQWLDCVHQLQHQFPTAFQFSGAYLVKLAQHTYSCLFGTFLCNTRQERLQHVIGRTFNVWRYLDHPQFVNRLYAPPLPGCHVLWPACNVRDLILWTDVYIGSTEANSHSMETSQSVLVGVSAARSASGMSGNTSNGNNTPGIASAGNAGSNSANSAGAMTKTRSYGDLMGMIGNNVAVRRCSDPNIIIDTLKLTTLNQTESKEPSEIEITTNHVTTNGVSHHNGTDSGEESSPSCTPPQQNGFGPPQMLQEVKNRLPPRPTRDINHNGCGEDSDDADRSDSRSEVTLCSNKQIKSTETSTDTLVAENGVITNNEVIQNDAVEPIQNGASDGCEVCAQNRKFIGNKHLHGHLHVGSRTTSGSNKPLRYSTPPPYCGPGPGGGVVSLHGLDVDGLALIRSDVQHRLGQIQEEFRLREEALQRELHTTRLALIKQVCHNCNHHDPDRLDTDTGSLVGSVCSAGDREAGSVGDSLPSDLSWEALDEGVNGDVAAGLAAQRTLWVPDHAVSRCTGCSTEFWLGRRKHHCRSCGRIFCADCSENSAPLPSEQLYNPVRVCTQCYSQLRRSCSQHPASTNGAPPNSQPLTLTATSN